MTEPVLAALVKRRADLSGEMHTLQSRLHEVHACLASLDDVIKQFDPDYPLVAIRPKYRREGTPGETASISRAVLDTLRRSGSAMAVKPLALAIMTARGLNQDDRALVRSMAKRVDMALRYQRTNGMVQSREEGALVVWELVAA